MQQHEDPLNERVKRVETAVNRYLAAILSGNKEEMEAAYKA